MMWAIAMSHPQEDLLHETAEGTVDQTRAVLHDVFAEFSLSMVQGSQDRLRKYRRTHRTFSGDVFYCKDSMESGEQSEIFF